MSSDIVEEVKVREKGYKTYKERQAEAGVKAEVKEAQKSETLEQKAERLGREAAERRVKRAKGSEAYAYTVTQGEGKGKGRTVVNPPPTGRLGKAGKERASKMEKERVKADRTRRKKQKAV